MGVLGGGDWWGAWWGAWWGCLVGVPGGDAWRDAWQGELEQSWESHSLEIRGQGSLPEP